MTSAAELGTRVGPVRSAGRAPTGWRVPARVAVPVAAACGGLLMLSFPPYGLWWLAPVAVAGLAAVVHRRRVVPAAGLGWLAGLAFFVPLLSWTSIVGGWLPWLILSVAQGAYLAVMAGVAAWVSPLVDRWRGVWPVVVGVCWVAQEAVRDRVPFGGFPWGRLAFGQGGSPLLRFAALGGAPLVTFLVAVCGGLLLVAGWRDWPAAVRRWRAGQWRAVGAAVAAGVAAVLLAVAGLLVPVGVAGGGGRALTVAVVQGNVPRMGLEFNAQRRAVLDNHVDATLELAGRVAAGAVPAPDLVVWPENSSDIDPLVPRNADARARIDQAADAIGVPILVGAVLTGPGRHARNAAIVWWPGSGPAEPIYVKQHPVPFAEYMPLRSLARMVTSRADLVRTDFVAGHRPGVLRAGAVTVGDVICFEVGYDDLVRSAVTGGGQILVVQTNNADFNPAEALQQLAMVRLRAVEHGRDALMASTVGVSAFVTADGRVWDASGWNTRAVLVRQLRPATERTLASEIGPIPEYVLVGLGVMALFSAALIRRRRLTSLEEA